MKDKFARFAAYPFYGLSYAAGFIAGLALIIRGAVVTGWQDGMGALHGRSAE